MTDISTVAPVAIAATAPQQAPQQAPGIQDTTATARTVTAQTDQAIAPAQESAAAGPDGANPPPAHGRGRVLDIEV